MYSIISRHDTIEKIFIDEDMDNCDKDEEVHVERSIYLRQQETNLSFEARLYVANLRDTEPINFVLITANEVPGLKVDKIIKNVPFDFFEKLQKEDL